MPASFDSNHVTKLGELYSFITGIWNKCKNKFAAKNDLATIATSGSWNDLSDKPTIPTVPVQDVTVDGTSVVNAEGVAEIPSYTQVQSNWTESDTANPAYIQNKPDFFIAQYGVTPYAQILAAYNTGINVLCSYGSSTDRMLGILGYAYINSSHALASRNFEFAYFKPKNRDNQATAANQGIAEIETWKVYGDDHWEQVSKIVAPLIAPGTGISTSYSSSSRTLTVEVSSAVRAGAASGTTAVQPEDLAAIATSGSWNDLSDKPTIPVVPTTDQTYDASSSNPQSGTAVAGAIAGVNQVPAATSSDSGKVLTVNSSGSPEWQTGGGTQQQADWAQTDSTAADYIKNKPTIPAAWDYTQVNITQTGSGASHRFVINEDKPVTYQSGGTGYTHDSTYSDINIRENANAAKHDWIFKFSGSIRHNVTLRIYDSTNSLSSRYIMIGHTNYGTTLADYNERTAISYGTGEISVNIGYLTTSYGRLTVMKRGTLIFVYTK